MTLVHRIVVQQRDDITLLDINTPEHDSAHAQTLALDGIERGRRIDHMTRAQAVMWLQQLEANARFIADAEITDADLRGTIVALQKDAEAIARVAFPRDHTVREETLADIARAVARAMS